MIISWDKYAVKDTDENTLILTKSGRLFWVAPDQWSLAGELFESAYSTIFSEDIARHLAGCEREFNKRDTYLVKCNNFIERFFIFIFFALFWLLFCMGGIGSWEL